MLNRLEPELEEITKQRLNGFNTIACAFETLIAHMLRPEPRVTQRAECALWGSNRSKLWRTRQGYSGSGLLVDNGGALLTAPKNVRNYAVQLEGT